jgi:hypothetical protein
MPLLRRRNMPAGIRAVIVIQISAFRKEARRFSIVCAIMGTVILPRKGFSTDEPKNDR